MSLGNGLYRHEIVEMSLHFEWVCLFVASKECIRCEERGWNLLAAAAVAAYWLESRGDEEWCWWRPADSRPHGSRAPSSFHRRWRQTVPVSCRQPSSMPSTSPAWTVTHTTTNVSCTNCHTNRRHLQHELSHKPLTSPAPTVTQTTDVTCTNCHTNHRRLLHELSHKPLAMQLKPVTARTSKPVSK